MKMGSFGKLKLRKNVQLLIGSMLDLDQEQTKLANYERQAYEQEKLCRSFYVTASILYCPIQYDSIHLNFLRIQTKSCTDGF